MRHFLSIILCVSFCMPVGAIAATALREEGLSMTITPPLFQLSLAPGATWKSVLNLENRNSYDITLFTFTQNFNTSGESGMALFSPSGDTSHPNSHELATWISVDPTPFTLKKGKTAHIPFTLQVPKDAEPGGHYAAILVGTEPGKNATGAAFGSMLSSLFFVRVAGDIVEEANIRDFYATDKYVDTQEADFLLRFSNTGNVHVTPTGDITIYNMFGRPRGTISIDGPRSIGTILPETTRKFSFLWKGKHNFFDIGRYKAVATLNFGMDGTKQVKRTAYFWVIPWMPLLVTALFLFSFGFFFRFSLRRYIAKAIAIERERIGLSESEPATKDPRMSLAILRLPIEEGAIDLRNARNMKENAVAEGKKPMSYRIFYRKYRSFVWSVIVFVLGFAAIITYLIAVFQSERGYDIVIEKDGVHDIVVHGDQGR